MQVMYLIGRIQRGGQFYVALEEAKLLRIRGCSVAMGGLTASSRAILELRRCGIEVYIGLESIIEGISKYDLIHVHDGLRIFLTAKLGNKALNNLLSKKPVVVTYHGMPSLKIVEFKKWPDLIVFKTLYYRLLRRYANQVIAISEFVKRELKNHGIRNVIVVHNGIVVEDHLPNREHPLDVGQLKLLYIGSAAKHKRVDFLLKYLVESKKHIDRVLNVDISLTVAGFGCDKFKKLVERHRWIKIFGSLERENILHLYHTHHVFISASMWEGFGLPYLEALGRGLPVIARDIPITRELLTNCEAAFLLKLGNPAELIEILKIIINNYRYLERKAWEHAQEFRLDKHVNCLVKVYERVLRS
ncbi:MAG: hypothetical protein B6U76_00710 [Desulfurococcales archaeon ex4484_217_2]|nr:MAG: hypothetical protein B6U76_00710 [Desulfurococcales archaeon ex4484_217_2]